MLEKNNFTKDIGIKIFSDDFDLVSNFLRNGKPIPPLTLVELRKGADLFDTVAVKFGIYRSGTLIKNRFLIFPLICRMFRIAIESESVNRFKEVLGLTGLLLDNQSKNLDGVKYSDPYWDLPSILSYCLDNNKLSRETSSCESRIYIATIGFLLVVMRVSERPDDIKPDLATFNWIATNEPGTNLGPGMNRCADLRNEYGPKYFDSFLDIMSNVVQTTISEEQRTRGNNFKNDVDSVTQHLLDLAKQHIEMLSCSGG